MRTINFKLTNFARNGNLFRLSACRRGAECGKTSSNEEFFPSSGPDNCSSNGQGYAGPSATGKPVWSSGCSSRPGVPTDAADPYLTTPRTQITEPKAQIADPRPTTVETRAFSDLLSVRFFCNKLAQRVSFVASQRPLSTSGQTMDKALAS